MLQLMHQVLRSSPPFRVVMSQFSRAEIRNYGSDNAKHRDYIDLTFLALRPSANVRFFNVTRRIADRASQIGSDYPRITVPDAIHIATALDSGVSRFWTYDGVRDKERRRSGGLLQFSGIIDELIIEEPNPNWRLPLFEA